MPTVDGTGENAVLGGGDHGAKHHLSGDLGFFLGGTGEQKTRAVRNDTHLFSGQIWDFRCPWGDLYSFGHVAVLHVQALYVLHPTTTRSGESSSPAQPGDARASPWLVVDA